MANYYEDIGPIGSQKVRMQFGPVDVEEGEPSQVPGDEHIREMVVIFNYDDLPTFSTNQMVLAIPSNSQIVDARLGIITPFAGGTSIAVGTYTRAGVEIDLDGLVTAAQGALANLTPAGKWIVGTGAQVGAGIGSNDGNLVVTAVGTFTAGKAKLLVRYLPLLDHAAQ